MRNAGARVALASWPLLIDRFRTHLPHRAEMLLIDLPGLRFILLKEPFEDTNPLAP